LPEGLRLFLIEKEWMEKMKEISINTSGLSSFKKRFFGWFNMFRIVKYLNYVHQDHLKKTAVEASACELLDAIGIQAGSNDPTELLSLYRTLEKNH
jgi:hypothetical protein